MGIIMEIAQDTNMGLTQNTKSEEIKFDADISQLMGLIINSFYSKNEIFLRELLSNSSDALEKIRYESLTNKEVLDTESNLKIKVWVDSDTDGVKNLVIEDTGIGMTKYDLINTLGTIAKSGTKSFIEKIKNKEVDQIGQFGVGFYSSYLVADNVKIYTKHNDDKEYIWESTSEKTYTITENDNPILTRGTRIHLRIKEDHEEVLENAKAQTSEKNIENTEVETSEKNIENAEAEIVETSEKNIENAEAEIVEKSEKNIENAEGGEEVNKEDHVNIEDVDEDDDEDDEEKEEQPKKKKVKKTITEWNIINN